MTERLVSPSPWFVRLRPAERPRVRLICFPYAGGGANAYRWLADALPGEPPDGGSGAQPEGPSEVSPKGVSHRGPSAGIHSRREPPDGVELCAAQLPGRESRLFEPPLGDLRAVIAALRGPLPVTPDVPFAFFGHSMGALLAFELARALRDAGAPGPAALFVSGARAPQRGTGHRRHELTDEAFREELARLDGTPRELLENAELMGFMLPALRADFGLCDTYTFEPGDPLDCPITAFGGAADAEARPEDFGGWAELTTGAYALHVFPGDHFFLLKGAGRALAQLVAARLAALAAPAPGARP